ncbi:ATP-binding cassette domain-containing protein [Enterococcus sp. DIV0242_7C1]|uniref:ABC transporter ATP-binding protein n=2 Tax=Candidatus Enterococcus dunnyi TaxID=1834192 RepID=A0AAQ3W0H4_9ENTE|nr:ATP-binding cassette domain-containing protein [Enterococcus sp. DIV0242_7C1]
MDKSPFGAFTLFNSLQNINMKNIIFLSKKLSKKKLIAFSILFLFISLSNLITPFLSSFIVSQYVEGQLVENIRNLILIFSIQIIFLVFRFFYEYKKSKFLFYTDFNLKSNFLSVLQEKTLTFSLTKRTGEVQYRMFNDIATMIRGIETFYINTPSVLLTLLIVIIIVARISFLILIFSIIMIIVLVIQFIYFQSPLKKSFEETKKLEQDLVGEMNEHFDRIEIIQLYNKESSSLISFDLKFGDLIAKYLKQKKINLLGVSFSSIIVQVWLIGITVISMVLLSTGDISLGQFVLLSQMVYFLPTSIGSLLNTVWEYQDCSVSIQRFKTFMEDSQLNEGDVKIYSIDSITFENVEVILNSHTISPEINLSVEKGDFVLIKGENGAGKSSLIRILSKLLPLECGNIHINHIDLNKVEKRSLRERLSVATQTSYIFQNSLEENVFLSDGNNNIYMKMKQILSIDDKLTQKNVRVLSGGERQKINLMRAFVRDKEIMILDEPFSGLDQQSIENLLEYLAATKNNKIYFVVTHDNYFDQLANKIIQL